MEPFFLETKNTFICYFWMKKQTAKTEVENIDKWWVGFLSVISEVSQKKISSSNYISFDSAWQGELKNSHAILLIFIMSNFSEKHDWEKRYIKWKRSKRRKNLDISHFTYFLFLKIYWLLTKKRPLCPIKIWRPFRESVREI